MSKKKIHAMSFYDSQRFKSALALSQEVLFSKFKFRKLKGRTRSARIDAQLEQDPASQQVWESFVEELSKAVLLWSTD